MRRILLLLLALPLVGCLDPGLAFDPGLYDSAPVARFTTPSSAALDRALVLDGSTSYDPDGDTLTWQWRIDAQPAGSALPASPFAANGDRNAEVTSFVPDVLGRYTVALQVHSGLLVSESTYAVINVVPDGTLPDADAGPDRVALEGTEVCLDGSESRDPLGVNITYAWSLASQPDTSALSSVDLDGADTSITCFTPDAAGLFTVGLTVAAGPRVGQPDYVDVLVQSTNQPPLADALALDTSSCAFVRFDGSGSSDADGDALAYRWSLLLAPEGSGTPLGGAAFDDDAAMQPSLYADAPGTYTVELSVFDGEAWSAPHLVQVDTTPKLSNTPPTVAQQGDIYLADSPLPCNSSCPPAQVMLSAEGTLDADGDPLTVSWEVVIGDASVDSQQGPLTELTVDGLPGSCVANYPSSELVTVRVTATDCSGDTDSSEFLVLYECGLGL